MNKLLCVFSFLICFPAASQTRSKEEYTGLNYAKPALLSKSIQEGNYKEDVLPNTQSLCFVGDLKAVFTCVNDLSTDSSLYKLLAQYPATYFSFEQVIERIKNEQVVMINEAHDRIKPRAFIYDLLPLFKKAGFTHLAMETITEKANKELTYKTGIYTSEPTMGLLYRRAVKLGFKFIAYDNTEKNRDSIQAVNLWKAINDSTEIHKTLVICGYGHLTEWCSNPKDKLMGSYFKEISGVNPLTIDQVEMAEFSKSAYLRTLHQFFVDTISKFIDGSNFVFPPICDIYICHPKTKFEHNRSTDILLDGERELKPIQVKDTETIIVQQYLASEINQPSDFSTRIPTDQTTYIDVERNAYLAFFSREKYIIIMRNAKNEILSSKKMAVK